MSRARVAFLVVSVALGGCTQHRTVPKSKQPCAEACAASQSGCVGQCAAPKGNPAVLEDVRDSLCQKRCRQDYEDCMQDCL